MSPKYIIEHIDGIDEVTVFEPFPAEEFLRMLKQLTSHLRLYEFRVAWDVTSDQVKKVARKPPTLKPKPGSRVALVNSDKVGFGMGNMFRSYRESSGRDAPEYRIFYDREEARRWLKS
ncbi:MAG: hypothetical protein QNJ40_13570 [Xanthomonadales bacterium]|nr:hypothetical protein [Xanthomonadales bacterium]